MKLSPQTAEASFTSAATAVGLAAEVAVPWPVLYLKPEPQDKAEPSAMIARLLSMPAEIETTFSRPGSDQHGRHIQELLWTYPAQELASRMPLSRL